MKITILSENYPPVTGGVAIHVKNEAELLADRGHNVKVVTIGKEGDINETRTQNGVKVERVSRKDFLTYGQKRNREEDLISIHQYRHPLSDIASFLIENPKVKRVHGIYPPKSSFDSLRKRAYDFFGRKILNNFDIITALSKTQKDQLKEIGIESEKIEIFPNAVNAEEWLESLENVDGNFKEKFGINTDYFGIVVGRLDWNKGIEDCIRALKYVIRDDLSFTGAVIGPDPRGTKNNFERMSKKVGVAENIVFTGKLPYEDLVLAYKQADLLLMPSFYEGFPTVVMEAMLSKTPVIATPNGGTKHLVKDGETGYLCEYGNPKSIYQKIRHVFGDEKEKEVVENAYFHVRNNYTWSNLIERLEEIYLKAFKRHDCQKSFNS